MASNLKFRVVTVIVILTTLLGIYSASLWNAYPRGFNFSIWYTAGCLVRSNMSMHIYDGAEQNKNPQTIPADPQSVFAQTAHAHGIPLATLFRYLYPPTLADLVVPLSFFPRSAAWIVWNILAVLMIVGLSAALTRILAMPLFGSTVLVAAAVLLFRPTLNTLYFGQITILLAFLLTVGFSSYANGHKIIATFLFALSIAIKLEPIVVIIPLIAWRDWKCLRSLAVWGILLGIGLWAINGSYALDLYFLHDLPAMSAGDLGGTGAFDVNRSLGNIFYFCDYSRGIHPSVGLAWLVRAVSALILCYAGWLSRLAPGENLINRQRFETGVVFLLFACCLSPYSWFYNWALSAPVLVMFCKRAWDGRADTVETILLTALLLSLTTSQFGMAMVTPLLGIALGIVALRRMRPERRPAESHSSIDQLTTVSVS